MKKTQNPTKTFSRYELLTFLLKKLFKSNFKSISYLTLIFFYLPNNLNCQSWDLKLNVITPQLPAKLGTASNDPLHFYTNGIERMSISNSGNIKLNAFNGPSDRFLQVDADGNLFPWIGNNSNPNSILFSDGSWRPNLISVEGDIMHIPLNTKFGLGTVNPNSELDVVGNASISNNLTINNNLNLGTANEFAQMSFVPSDGNQPSILSFKPISTNNNNNGNNGGYDPDPLPNLNCINGNLNTVNIFSDLLCIKKSYNQTSLGNINIGHNGNRGFIETQGTNITEPNSHPGNLFINAQCNRNVYFFADNGTAFAPHLNKIMSINGRLNVTDIIQIGNSSFSNFLESNSKLYVYASGIQDGVKIRHGGIHNGAAFRAIELSDSDKGISVYRGTQNADGSEMFSVQGDGLTVISPSNAKALSILNNGNETFSINKDGYTEIKVNSTSGMPNNRVMSIIDMNLNRDLFVVKSNGKVYAREIEINLLQTFPDYVFDNNYNLTNLDDLEKYIKANKHLPSFESAEYYEKNGLNINTLLVKQQEKIEELFLYIIALENKIENK